MPVGVCLGGMVFGFRRDWTETRTSGTSVKLFEGPVGCRPMLIPGKRSRRRLRGEALGTVIDDIFGVVNKRKSTTLGTIPPDTAVS